MKPVPPLPYFQTTRYRVRAMVDLVMVYQNCIPNAAYKMADLGSGDGRIVIAFAAAGIEAHGYETNEQLCTLAQKNIHDEGITGKAFIHNKNFWTENLSQYSVITVYGMPDIMHELEVKLWSELTEGALIVSNYYTFSHPEIDRKDNIFLYKV